MPPAENAARPAGIVEDERRPPARTTVISRHIAEYLARSGRPRRRRLAPPARIQRCANGVVRLTGAWCECSAAGEEVRGLVSR